MFLCLYFLSASCGLWCCFFSIFFFVVCTIAHTHSIYERLHICLKILVPHLSYTQHKTQNIIELLLAYAVVVAVVGLFKNEKRTNEHIYIYIHLNNRRVTEQRRWIMEATHTKLNLPNRFSFGFIRIAPIIPSSIASIQQITLHDHDNDDDDDDAAQSEQPHSHHDGLMFASRVCVCVCVGFFFILIRF